MDGSQRDGGGVALGAWKSGAGSQRPGDRQVLAAQGPAVGPAEQGHWAPEDSSQKPGVEQAHGAQRHADGQENLSPSPEVGLGEKTGSGFGPQRPEG